MNAHTHSARMRSGAGRALHGPSDLPRHELAWTAFQHPSRTWFTPTDRASFTASSRPWRQPRRATPGIDSMGMFSSPSCTNTGRMKLAAAGGPGECRRRPFVRQKHGRGGLRQGQRHLSLAPGAAPQELAGWGAGVHGLKTHRHVPAALRSAALCVKCCVQQSSSRKERAPGSRYVSLNARRTVSLLRLRRGREGRSRTGTTGVPSGTPRCREET